MEFKKKFTIMALFVLTPLYADDTVKVVTPSVKSASANSPLKDTPSSSANIEALKAVLKSKRTTANTSPTSTKASVVTPKKEEKPLAPVSLSDEERERIEKEQDAKDEERRRKSALLSTPTATPSDSPVRSVSSPKPILSKVDAQRSQRRQRLSEITTRKNILKKNVENSQKSVVSMHEAVGVQKSLVNDLIKQQSPSVKEAQDNLKLLEGNLKTVVTNQKKAEEELKRLESEATTLQKELEPSIKYKEPTSSLINATSPEPASMSETTDNKIAEKKPEDTISPEPLITSGSQATPPADYSVAPDTGEKRLQERLPKGQIGYLELLKMAATATALRVKSGIAAVYNWWYNKKDDSETAPPAPLPSEE